mgnify:CR=1 FL=1
MRLKKSYLLLLLFLIGCKGEYQAERSYWKANRLYTKIAKKPRLAKEEDFQKAIKGLKGLIVKYPKWQNTPEAQLMLGNLCLLKKDYERAREELNKAIKKYPEEVKVCAEAQFFIGRCYESEGEWEKALLEYQKVENNYPYTYSALQTPLQIAHYYKEQNRKIEAENAYQKAVMKCIDIISNIPSSDLALTAQDLIVNCYLEQEKWEAAIRTLQTISSIFYGAERGANSLLQIAFIYQKQLKNPEEAIKAYEEFLALYPNHRLAKKAEMELLSLKIITPNIGR